MKSVFNKSTLSFLGLLMMLCCSCAVRQRVKTDTAGKPTPEPANIVAKIGDYVITKEELKKKLMAELVPRRDEYDYNRKAGPVDANTVLMKMVAEKAMVIEARRKNYLEDESIRDSLKRFKEKKLVNLLLGAYLKDKITVTETEIDEKIKTNPKLKRIRAKAMLQRTKAGKLVNQFYSEIYKKFNAQKLSVNFPKVVRIHRRLLLYPKEPQKMRWIRVNQVRNELTPEEKNIVLATYDNGKVTLKDWFNALCQIAPPSRPRDLNTAKGVERLLDGVLRTPIFVAEAKSRGLDKDESLLKQIRKREDEKLLSKIMREKVKDIENPPTEEQIVAYFNENKKEFGTPETLKIDQIWCQNIETARKVKAELDSGKDFKSVRQEYSLEKKGRPFNTYPSYEGVFFKDLWKAEPNEIVGPVKGFYRKGVKWRIVKILEKKPGKVKEYTSDMKGNVKMKMQNEQREAILEKYRNELLKKYPYEIYAERIKDIDPLDIP